jgi:hypothetical protein
MRGRWEEHHRDHMLHRHHHRSDVAVSYLVFHFETAAVVSRQHLVRVLLASVDLPPMPWLVDVARSLIFPALHSYYSYYLYFMKSASVD